MSQVPAWDAFMIDVLRYLDDGRVRGVHEIRQGVIELARLTGEQKAALLPSGQSKVENRIGWAVSYLTRVGAIDRPARAQYRITPMGTDLLARYPDGITAHLLRTMAKPGDEWWEKRPATDKPSPRIDEAIVEPLDPIEQIEEGLNRIEQNVAADLLERLQSKEPVFFEQAVVRLLVAMGYGGAEGQGTVTPQAHDGGIDGIIDRDALGLDRIYIQAKRYASDSAVLRPEVQAFVGALSGKASSGVYLTTGRFSSGAIEYAENAHTRVILIDGARLVRLMIRYGVGVQIRRTLHIVEVDEDFFE